jgi:spermidine/putrescine transport system substrate-binding protein
MSTIDRRSFVGAALAVGATGCRCGSSGDPEDLTEMGDRLTIANWSDYVAEDTISRFEQEYGIEVDYTTYESSEELMAKLRVGAGGYDLVVPATNIVSALIAQDMLFPLDRRLLTNWGNVAPMFLDPAHDRGNQYGVPYLWGLTGIAYRTDKVPSPPTSWSVFHDKQFVGKMTQLDEMRDVIGCWVKYRGGSLNTRDRAELERAKQDAIAAKPNLAAYVSAAVKGPLVAGDVWIAQAWNGEVAQARAEQPNLAFVIPAEGGGIWVDSLVIPRSAPHKRAAHAFMDYVLRPEVGAALANHTGYGSPNAAAMSLLDHPAPFPSGEEFARLEFQIDLGEDLELWDQIWTEIKSA